MYHETLEQTSLISLIAPTACQIQLLSMFIASTAGPDLQTSDFPTHSLWLASVSEKATISKALVWSIRAIPISRLARVSYDDVLTETVRRMYGKALLLLNKALQYNEEGLSSDTLSAVLLLSFFEAFNCTDRNSWIRHAGGAGRLIHLRGPKRYGSGLGKLVFLASRFSIILEGYISRSLGF